jgi:hypothetical protein
VDAKGKIGQAHQKTKEAIFSNGLSNKQCHYHGMMLIASGAVLPGDNLALLPRAPVRWAGLSAGGPLAHHIYLSRAFDYLLLAFRYLQ